MAHNDTIKTLRLEQGLTQLDVALRAGIGYRTYQSVEKGEVTRTSTLEAIAAALGVTVGELYNGSAA